MSDETPAPLDPELTAYGALTEGMDPAAIQDPEIRSILTDRSKDLADIMRLVETHPELQVSLPDEVTALLD